MFGNHGLCGLPEEGAHEKSPKCLDGNLGDFWGDFAKVSGRLKSVSDGLDVYPSDIFSLRKSIKLRTFALRKALST